MLCIAGIASQDRPIGRRPCHLAFVIQLSQLLRQVQEGFSGDHMQLGEALRVSACPAMHLLLFLFLSSFNTQVIVLLTDFSNAHCSEAPDMICSEQCWLQALSSDNSFIALSDTACLNKNRCKANALV